MILNFLEYINLFIKIIEYICIYFLILLINKGEKKENEIFFKFVK